MTDILLHKNAFPVLPTKSQCYGRVICHLETVCTTRSDHVVTYYQLKYNLNHDNQYLRVSFITYEIIMLWTPDESFRNAVYDTQ